jgi:hypothetical protein
MGQDQSKQLSNIINRAFTGTGTDIDPNQPRFTDAPSGPYPTMGPYGPNTVKVETGNVDISGFTMSSFKCTSDDDCMNMDAYRSKPGSSPVYSCPGAKCSGGSCNCGSDCKLDPYSGICCQGLEKIGQDIFCVESTGEPLKITDDSLATGKLLDSSGNPWDWISSPTNAFKHKGSSKGQSALSAHKDIHAKKQAFVAAKTASTCNIPDQILYSKDKSQYVTIPGSTICNVYKKYQL